MILKFKDVFQTSKEEKIKNWDMLHVELQSHIGKKVKTSLLIGKPNETEKDRKLIDVSYIETHHGISILLEMEEENKEKVSLLLPNVRKAKYDNSMRPHQTGYIKFHFECYNNMNDYAYIEHDPKKRQKLKFDLTEREKKLEEHRIVSGRIFLQD